MDETSRRCSNFTKEDMRRLQVLQNRVLRIKCHNYDMNTPTVDLLKSCGDLSVHQLGVFHTLLLVFNIVHSSQPEYLAKKLKLRRPEDDYVFPQRQVYICQGWSVTIKIGIHTQRSASLEHETAFRTKGIQDWIEKMDSRKCTSKAKLVDALKVSSNLHYFTSSIKMAMFQLMDEINLSLSLSGLMKN